MVIEDRSPGGRPVRDAVGVECGTMSRYLRRRKDGSWTPRQLFLLRDAIPLIQGPRGVALPDDAELILERFANTAVGDQLMRIAQDGAAKIPVFPDRKSVV